MLGSQLGFSPEEARVGRGVLGDAWAFGLSGGREMGPGARLGRHVGKARSWGRPEESQNRLQTRKFVFATWCRRKRRRARFGFCGRGSLCALNTAGVLSSEARVGNGW
ncbi:hypothetical protein ROHU_011125 [Labeo rohita]|uniref:Uncharacterized protein n=1 Tax=Labeo rohita TaxID=84645 RepID=A0A498LRD5_LABRO|nr:hypothetical protein ROHU_011125 [Labeo rohita]